MASLEKRGGKYRIVFRFAGQKFGRSLRTKSEKDAIGSLARLEDNLRRVELGTLPVPESVDLATFLLSDGKAELKPKVATTRTLSQLFESHLASFPAGSIEENTLRTMRIHSKVLKRIIGESFLIQSLALANLQAYVTQRSTTLGRHGKPISAVTVKKELVTLRAAWNWAMHMGIVTKPFPSRGLRLPKTAEKPPFQTLEEIERRIKRGDLAPPEEAELWECLFLTLPEIDELLQYVKANARYPFIYPMFVFAAHTGARRSEMIRSQIDDIDFESGTVLIREKKRVRGRLSTRRVPLSPLFNKVIRDWLSNHPGGSSTFCQTFDVPDGKERTGHGPLTIDAAHDHFKRTLASSRWAKVKGWHVFRHSFCSNCAARGIDQRLINAWVGHQTEEMVRRYRHVIPNQERTAIELVFPNGNH